ncbi:MAG: FAD-dependent oxidoreductase [Burkholderiaceae bacterium]|nr:FAD-dependent oxidoreductase [Burkholderiaceae bacterium]
MKHLLLVGGGQTHALVLRELARTRPAGVDVVLVTPTASLIYSGMLPGWMAGHYSLDQLLIPLAPLVRAAGARIAYGNVLTLDFSNRQVLSDAGEAFHFDILSIATGATMDVESISGAREYSLPLRPLERFVTGWQAILQRAARARGTFQLTVVGGGAGGAETALAAARRARSLASSVRVQLITGGVPILPGHGSHARALMHAALREHEVEVIEGTAVEISAEAIQLGDGRRVGTDATLLMTGAAAPAWPGAAGLAVDQRGFVAVNAHLQSISHPLVFAAGDVATLTHAPRPKSGVYAVRAAPTLAANLVAAANLTPMLSFAPQRRALYLLSTGGRQAIASWGRWAIVGRWVWRWKHRIDRHYIARLKSAD